MSETDSANRSRRNMTKHQTLVLNQAFVQEMKPPHNYYRELGTLIGLTPKQVRIWFQNKRARLKKTGGPVTGPYRAKNYPNGKTLACANIKLPPMHPPNKDHAKKSATSKRTSHLLDGGSTTTTTTTSSTASSKPKKRRAKTAPGTKQASKRRPTSVDSSTTALSGLIALSQASTQLGLHPDDSPPSTQHNTSNLKRSSGAVVAISNIFYIFSFCHFLFFIFQLFWHRQRRAKHRLNPIKPPTLTRFPIWPQTVAVMS